MPFLGKQPSQGINKTVLLDAFNATATAAYSLEKDSVAYTPASAQSLIVSLNGVTQAPIAAYTLSSNTITFASDLTTDDVIDYIIALEGPISTAVTVDDDAISTIMLKNDAVTADKLANSINTDIATGVAALPKAGGAMTGAITTNSTFDGRDVGTDGTKLDGIETSATADQTGAQIKTAYEAQSNAFTDAQFTKLAGVATSANNYVHPNHSGEVTSTADGATVIASAVVDEDNLLISNGGSDGNFLQKQSGNAGGLTWAAAGGTYSAWLVKDDDFTCASGAQLVCNHASAAFTITLPAGSAGNTVVIANAGAALVTIEANGSEKINSSTDDGTLPQGNSVQLVYVDSGIGWFEV